MKTGITGGPASARRILKAVLVLGCVAAMFAALGGSALAKKPAGKKPAGKTNTAAKGPKLTPRTPITRGSAYLALGDSVTFGYEEAQVVPAPNYADAASFLGYPELLGAELHLTVANAACSGETSASLINPSAQSNGCENTPGKGSVGYRTLYPLHVHYTGSQLAFAVSYLKKHHNVRLVSLMIGANDAFVCQETTADHCASLTELEAVAVQVAKNIHTILAAIRNKAHYNGQLAIVNYYSLNYANAIDNANSAFLNKTADTAAKPFHVEIADGFGEFGAAAAHSGGNSCIAGLLTQLANAPAPCGIHPSYAGQSLLAQALERVIHLG
jgi:lysophospholipase L1-like esterase